MTTPPFMKKFKRGPKSVRSILTAHGCNPEGKPVVTIAFGGHYATLGADDVEAFCDRLREHLAAAKTTGEV